MDQGGRDWFVPISKFPAGSGLRIFLTDSFFQTVWVDREADSSKKETAEKINRFKNFVIPFSHCLFFFHKKLVSLQEGR